MFVRARVRLCVFIFICVSTSLHDHLHGDGNDSPPSRLSDGICCVYSPQKQKLNTHLPIRHKQMPKQVFKKGNYLNTQCRKSLVYMFAFLTPAFFAAYFLVEIVFMRVTSSPEVKCRCALMRLTQTFTLQPIFSSDNYVSSCKFCPILQQHLSCRPKTSLAFITTAVAFPAALTSPQNGADAWEASFCNQDSLFHTSLRPCVFTLVPTQSISPQCKCFQ